MVEAIARESGTVYVTASMGGVDDDDDDDDDADCEEGMTPDSAVALVTTSGCIAPANDKS